MPKPISSYRDRDAANGAMIPPWLACCAALLLCLPTLARASPDSPGTSRIVERPESDVLLLTLKLDQSILAETLPVYQDGSLILVPLGEICRLLDLGITVDVAHGLASGFFIDERRHFALDAISQRVIVEGKPRRYDPARIEIHQDDIYVDAAMISGWLPLRLDVDLYGALITVRPVERLPLQSRLERERKLEMSGANHQRMKLSYPRLELPYDLFDTPFIDQTLGYARQPVPMGGSSGGDYSTYATGDVLFMGGDVFVSGTRQGITNSRLSLSRKDPEGRLLGFLRAREVTIGDVFLPGLDLITSGRSGPGLSIGNFPLDQQTQFDRQSFRGDLPPGWEVELYRGTELLAYAQSRPDGLYEFLDLPLLFGLNIFRVEFYGPQGQRRSETHRFNVGDTLTPKGRVYYRLAGNDPGLHRLGTVPAEGNAQTSFVLSAGLTRHFSASLSLASVDSAQRRSDYGKAALRGYWRSLFVNVDFAANRDGGTAWQPTLQSRLGAFGLQVQHVQLNAFVSDQFLSQTAPLRSRTMIRFDTAMPETWLPRIPVFLEARQDRLETGQRISELSGHVSAFRRGFAVTNQMTRSFSSGVDSAGRAPTSGQLLVSKSHQALEVRGVIDYGVGPHLDVKSVALTGERRLAPGLLVSAGVSRMIGSRQTRLLAGASKFEGTFGLSVWTDYSIANGFGAGARFSMSIGRDGRNGRWHSQARPLASSGAVSGRAFLDTNGNGVLDVTEQAIPDAGFLVNGTEQSERTNNVGEVFLTNLPPNRDVNLALAATTLEDPFWKSTREGVRIVPRPGKVVIVDFPVVVYGEITGTVHRRTGKEVREASGVEVKLVDSSGVVVKRVRTSFDGFYDIVEVRPGAYTLSVMPNEPAPQRVAAPSRDVKMLPGGTVLDGVDFVLELPPPARKAPRVVRPARRVATALHRD